MIQRTITKDVKFIIGYHTQECRYNDELRVPKICNSDKAWLGIGYYFWLEEEFAHYWGIDTKIKKTGAYDIYKAYIEEENILNASFNEKVYFRFREMIEKTVELFKSKGKIVTLLQVNKFLSDNFWKQNNVKGIIFDDIPRNKPEIERYYSHIEPLYYKKRIQMVVFELKIIHNFALYKGN